MLAKPILSNPYAFLFGCFCSGLGFGPLILRRAFCFVPRDNAPKENHEQRAEEGGDEVLECDLQIPEPEVDSEQLEQLAADRRADNAHDEVRPAAQTLLFEGDSASSQRPCEAADDDPHDDLPHVHRLNAAVMEMPSASRKCIVHRSIRDPRVFLSFVVRSR